MRALLIISTLLCIFITLDGKAQNWDTIDKHRDLINSQGEISKNACGSNKDVVYHFRELLYKLSLKMFKKIASVSNAHFVFSPLSLWQTLAAIAEGASGQTKEELLHFLLLPKDECFRNQFYHLASSLEAPSDDVKLVRLSSLILDDRVDVNKHWEYYIRRYFLLQTTAAPLKIDRLGAADLIRKYASLQMPTPNLEGNSIIVDSLDFEGLWTEAFSDAIVERAPFFDDLGKKVGYVDFMKMKKRVKMTYIPSINAKILELPVGYGGRYRMLFGMTLGSSEVRISIPSIMDNVIFEIMETMKESIIPLDIMIPRFRMTTEIDMRKILEDLGVRALWKDAEGTKNISNPAALPSSYIQRSTITFDTTGLRAPIQEVSNLVPGNQKGPAALDIETGLDDIVGRDFIADKPVMFGFFDSKTYTTLFTATFSTPTYKI